jgi:hypothetical protein
LTVQAEGLQELAYAEIEDFLVHCRFPVFG